MRKILAALALALGLGALAAPARAQDMPMAMDSAHLSMMRTELGLSDAQMARITEIHARLAETMRAHCAQVRAAGGPNAQTHQAMHGQMQQAMENAHREAMAVLTDAQRTRMESLHAQHHQGGHDMHGEHAEHDMHAEHAAAGGHDEHAGHGAAMCQQAECTEAHCHDCCAAANSEHTHR